jgi:hypothetical protein
MENIQTSEGKFDEVKLDIIGISMIRYSQIITIIITAYDVL